MHSLKENALDKLHQAAGTRVKEVTLDKGFLHVDLFDGLRLTGPAKRPGAGNEPSALVETGPGSHWDPGHNLDQLLGDAA